MADCQHDTIAFLSDPSSYGSGIGDVEILETHISLVFLAGERAYKLKRAVKFPYLDFSTAEHRRRACEAELALNRRTASELYQEVRAICRRTDGRLGWGDAGTILDWVVVMRRFDQDRRLDAIAAAGGLNPPLLYALAAHIADFHARAEHRPDYGGSAAVAKIILENDGCLRASRSVAFSDQSIRELRRRSKDWLRRLGGLLEQRRATGKVRRCHGDLHLSNICVLDDQPILFDCLEFSEDLASVDVLFDLAFLLMDMENQGYPEAANLVFNRYLDLTEEEDGLAAMPLFLSLRAAIRAHVTASALDKATAGHGEAAGAQHYLDQACAVLQPPAARLIAIGGLSGTGKSTLAAALAPELGTRPGARVLRSDVIRKRLFGLDPEAQLPEGAYTHKVTGRVYDALCAKAAAALKSGHCAVIDAVAVRAEERESFAELARQAQVPFDGLWLEAPREVMMARVDARQRDASEATREIVEQQLRFDSGAPDWSQIDAGKEPLATLVAARKALGLT